MRETHNYPRQWLPYILRLPTPRAYRVGALQRYTPVYSKRRGEILLYTGEPPGLLAEYPQCFFLSQQKCNASPNDFLLRQANFAGCLPWSFPERRFVANFNAYTGDLHNCLLASDKKILVFKEIFSFPVIFCNWVFSLRSWGTVLFSWVWAKRCVFAGINTGRAGILRRRPRIGRYWGFSRTGSEESTTDVPFSMNAPSGPVSLAAMCSVAPIGRMWLTLVVAGV